MCFEFARKPDLGNLSSVTLYISWDNIAVYPKTTSYKPTQIPKSASGTIVYQEGELIWRMAVTQGEVIYAIVSGGDFASC